MICVCLAKSLAQIRVKILHLRPEILGTEMEIVTDSWIKLQKEKNESSSIKCLFGSSFDGNINENSCCVIFGIS